MTDAGWQNWAGTVAALPVSTVTACSDGEIVAAVRQARRLGQRIKVLGSGHSYNDIADPTAAVCVALGSGNGLESVDRDTNRVTARAGMRLDRFCGALASHGLALPVLGAITEQTLGGLISTGTHGTGREVRSISDYVVGLRLIDGRGEAVDLTLEREPDLLRAARVGLGSLGIISSVTFACVPAFDLTLETRPAKLHDVMSGLDAHNLADHFGFWWFPHTEWASLRTARRCHRADAAVVRARRRAGSRFVDLAHEASLWFLGRGPRGSAVINAAQRALLFGRPRFAEGRWDDIFPCSGSMRQLAMEYAMPIETSTSMFPALEEIVRRYAVHAPVDVRFGASDEAWLSPSHGRQTCYVGVAVAQPFGRRIRHEALFAELEALFVSLSGRPHWGKLHTLEAARLRALYPHWDRFIEARNFLDPDRIFANPHLSRVLGD